MSRYSSNLPSPPRVPATPTPSAASAADGTERARARARQFLPDLVDLLAAIALADSSEAALHTRMMCAKEIVAVAGVIPVPVPVPPQPHNEDGDGGGDGDSDGGGTPS